MDNHGDGDGAAEFYRSNTDVFDDLCSRLGRSMQTETWGVELRVDGQFKAVDQTIETPVFLACASAETRAIKHFEALGHSDVRATRSYYKSTTERPRIVCLCGSTRFIELFAVMTWELERAGAIALGCALLPYWYCNVSDHFAEHVGCKETYDELHRRKIELSDNLLVLNVGGYIGESTAAEIEYAKKTGKPVYYLEPAAISTGEPARHRDTRRRNRG